MNDYEKDVSIDEDQLEKEWIKQASLFQKYASLLTKADFKRKEQKERIDYIRATLDLTFRKKFLEEGTKFTEKVIDSNITVTNDYQLELKILSDLECEYSMLASAVGALGHKKKALENLVQLWLASYFSTPRQKQTTDSNNNIDDMVTNKFQEEQRKKLNRNKENDNE